MLDIGATGATDAMKDAAISLTPGKQLIGKIPFEVIAPGKSADIALTKDTKGKSTLDVDAFLARDTFDALKESLVTSVPAGYYHKIHLIFAIDPAVGKEGEV